MESGIYFNGGWESVVDQREWDETLRKIRETDHYVLLPNDFDMPLGTVTFAYLNFNGGIDVWELVP